MSKKRSSLKNIYEEKKMFLLMVQDESSEDETVDPALKEAEAKLKKMVDQVIL